MKPPICLTNLARMESVIADCEADAKRIDGMAFNGKNVGELLGGMLAAIQCVAHVVKDILEE